MPYIYPGVDSLLKQPFIKDGDCVDLIKALVPGLIGKSTTSWKQGERLIRVPPPREQKFADGTWRDAGNNALAYYVIAQ